MSSSRDRDSGWGRLSHGAPLAVFVAVVLYIMYMLLPVLELIALAALVALIFRTTLKWIEKIVRVPWIAVTILVGVVIAFGVFIALVVVPSLFEEAQTLSDALPNYVNSLKPLSARLHTQFSFIPDLSGGLDQLKGVLNQVLSFFPLLLRNTVEVSIETLATIILALYMAYNPNSLIQGLLRLAPRREHGRIKTILQDIEVRLEGWLLGTGLGMLIIGVGATIGLWILKIPLAVSFGILAGIIEVIPYFGSIVGTLLPALVALTISPIKALLVVIFFLILNQVDVHLIQPVIMGNRVGLHPVVVIVAFLCFGKLLGFVGLIIAVPAAAVLMTLIDDLVPKTAEQEQSEAQQP
ncbi:AI-2E family transporter [Brasilonema sp. CT11]|nr:AI-2E family transporter [Brasilonema sp. CT11]